MREKKLESLCLQKLRCRSLPKRKKLQCRKQNIGVTKMMSLKAINYLVVYTDIKSPKTLWHLEIHSTRTISIYVFFCWVSLKSPKLPPNPPKYKIFSSLLKYSVQYTQLRGLGFDFKRSFFFHSSLGWTCRFTNH